LVSLEREGWGKGRDTLGCEGQLPRKTPPQFASGSLKRGIGSASAIKTEKKTYCNAQRAPKLIRKYCAILTDGEKLLENAVTKLGLSARAHDRILKVARTIADRDGAESLEAKHLSEAIQYRTLDRSYWA